MAYESGGKHQSKYRQRVITPIIYHLMRGALAYVAARSKRAHRLQQRYMLISQRAHLLANSIIHRLIISYRINRRSVA